MNSFLICISAILPIFLIIAVGYLAKRSGVVREDDVPHMNSIIFKVFIPVMCFYNIYTSDISSAIRPNLIVFTVFAIFAVYGLGFAYAILFVRERGNRSVVIQGIYRSNYLIVGLPMAAGLTEGGDIGVAAVMGAIIVPIFNVLAVVTLEAYNGQKPDIRALILNILKNPLILGSVAGILFLVCGIGLPSLIETAVRDMARVASPMMLFLLGAFFRFNGIGAHRKELAVVCVARLIVVPAVVLSMAILLGFRGIELITVMVAFASSTAVASFTMAQQIGGNAQLAGDIVVFTSALAFCDAFWLESASQNSEFDLILFILS